MRMRMRMCIGYVQPLSLPDLAFLQAARLRMMRSLTELACPHALALVFLLPRCRAVQARHLTAASAVAVAPHHRHVGMPRGAAISVHSVRHEVRFVVQSVRVSHNACVHRTERLCV
jgi:hypothetical protein